jgi:hypothetical protein
MVVKRIGIARRNSKSKNELNDIQETSNLAENLKQAFYQAYKEAYNDSIRY